MDRPSQHALLMTLQMDMMSNRLSDSNACQNLNVREMATLLIAALLLVSGANALSLGNEELIKSLMGDFTTVHNLTVSKFSFNDCGKEKLTFPFPFTFFSFRDRCVVFVILLLFMIIPHIPQELPPTPRT